jgi:S1-C subfamily serine protease
MALKRHHKVLIGGFGTLIIIALILMSILLYFSYTQEMQHYNELKDSITSLKLETQTQINSLSSNILQIQTKVQQSENSVTQQISLLKATTNQDFSGIINTTTPSVVTVRTDSGQGTGFIVNQSSGFDYIVTNAHVLADSNGNLASNIRIITNTQETITAQYIGYNSQLDLALLRIYGDYPALTLGDSGKLQIGEPVIAIGNPLGLEFSASNGIISYVNRSGVNGNPADYIQTTAALNPGNSGGPLINSKGEVIGINSFKISNGESLGFALGSDYIKTTINQIASQNLNETLINY